MRIRDLLAGLPVRSIILLLVIGVVRGFGLSQVLAQEEMHEPELALPPEESFLFFLYNGLGIRYVSYFGLLYLFQIVAWVAAVSVVVRNGSCPGTMVAASIAKGDLNEGWRAVQSDSSYVSRILKEVLAIPGISGSQACRLFAQRHENNRTQSRVVIKSLAFVAALAFFVGLYGTADGLIQSFSSFGGMLSPRSSDIFKAASYSFVTSYLGLGIACSATFWYGLFSAIHSWRMAAAALAGEELICRFLPEKSGK